jgi:hypothetical protein
MTVELKYTPGLALPPRVVGTYSSAFEALANVPGTIISAEEDADHPGCWDVAAARGPVLSIYCIEPVRRG